MKVELLKRLPVLLISTAVLLVSTGAAHADTTTKPYIKAYGGDVMAGGWFSSGNNCSTDTTSNYQNPNSSPSGFATDTRNGGILAYSNSSVNSSGGNSGQYAVFSVGEIDGRRAGDGFYSAGAQAVAGGSGSTSVKALTIANTDSTLAFGGQAEGTIPQSNCIPDYYSKKPSGALVTTNLSSVLARGSGTYADSAAAGSNFVLTDGAAGQTFQIPAGQRITIYINGNVYLNSNIVYDPSSAVGNVPKFALIVKGSIYIDKTVHELDGMYIAQPANTTSAAITTDDGIIWTCHPNNTAQLDYTYPPNCTSPLVVNGALIAKQINFLRVGGTTGSTNSDVSTTASTAEDGLGTVNTCTTAPYTNCHVSEVVNYTPAMIMGGDFFTQTSSSSTSGLPLDSVISLPPVF